MRRFSDHVINSASRSLVILIVVLIGVGGSGCAASLNPKKTSPQKAPQVQSPTNHFIKLVEKSSPGFSPSYQSFFLRLHVSNQGMQILQNNLLQNLPAQAPIVTHPEHHVTLLEIKAKQSQGFSSPSFIGSFEQRKRALEKVKERAQEFFEKQKLLQDSFTFEIERVHTFPGNTKAVVLLPTGMVQRNLVEFQDLLYREILDCMNAEGLHPLIEVSLWTQSTNYEPHLSIYKSPFNVGPLPQDLFHSIFQRISENLNHWRMNSIVAGTITLDTALFSY